MPVLVLETAAVETANHQSSIIVVLYHRNVITTAPRLRRYYRKCRIHQTKLCLLQSVPLKDNKEVKIISILPMYDKLKQCNNFITDYRLQSRVQCFVLD